MTTYTITIDDALIPGLADTLEQANAQRIMRRQPTFGSIDEMLADGVANTARVGLNNIAKARADKIARALAEGKTAEEAAASVM